MATEFESGSSVYLWFDRIIEIDKGKKARAIKSIRLTESYFIDHFPKFPIVPGMLQLEGLIQLGSWLIKISHSFRYDVIPLSIKGLDFRKYVRPSDELIFEVEILSLNSDNAIVKAKAIVDGKIVSNVKEIVFKYLPLTTKQATREKECFHQLLGNL
ncbi:3-hydroxyacyl-ACP dehydratase FabZ family protein [Chloroflexota bacterium]